MQLVSRDGRKRRVERETLRTNPEESCVTVERHRDHSLCPADVERPAPIDNKSHGILAYVDLRFPMVGNVNFVFLKGGNIQPEFSNERRQEIVLAHVQKVVGFEFLYCLFYCPFLIFEDIENRTTGE